MGIQLPPFNGQNLLLGIVSRALAGVVAKYCDECGKKLFAVLMAELDVYSRAIFSLPAEDESVGSVTNSSTHQL